MCCCRDNETSWYDVTIAVRILKLYWVVCCTQGRSEVLNIGGGGRLGTRGQLLFTESGLHTRIFAKENTSLLVRKRVNREEGRLATWICFDDYRKNKMELLSSGWLRDWHTVTGLNWPNAQLGFIKWLFWIWIYPTAWYIPGCMGL